MDKHQELKAQIEDFIKLLPDIDYADSLLSQRRVRRSPKRSLHNVMWERATQASADFVEKHIDTSLLFQNRENLWSYVVQNLKSSFDDGVGLEFGVASGESIAFFSRGLPGFKFYGFDSFYGLKEDWIGHHAPKGSYSQGGNLPKVSSNVELIAGWFHESLPAFLEKNQQNLSTLRFLHIDADTYEASVTVFEHLASYLSRGTLVLFDEFIGYPNWRNGEFKAWYEAQDRAKLAWRFRAFSSEQALIEIL